MKTNLCKSIGSRLELSKQTGCDGKLIYTLTKDNVTVLKKEYSKYIGGDIYIHRFTSDNKTVSTVPKNGSGVFVVSESLSDGGSLYIKGHLIKGKIIQLDSLVGEVSDNIKLKKYKSLLKKVANGDESLIPLSKYYLKKSIEFLSNKICF